jgi:hypothetical protein
MIQFIYKYTNEKILSKYTNNIMDTMTVGFKKTNCIIEEWELSNVTIFDQILMRYCMF